MIETILKVDGMMCGMCESHVNETVRKTADVKKVTSSHTKGETVILSEQELDIDALKAAIAETGYTVHAYLTGKRLALAREQIAAGTPILQAASACGFGDYSAFCRAYRRQFGQPPSSARQDAAETLKTRKKA